MNKILRVNIENSEGQEETKIEFALSVFKDFLESDIFWSVEHNGKGSSKFIQLFLMMDQMWS